MADVAEPLGLRPDEVTCDLLLGGAVTLFQNRRGHRAGTDAVLLARTAPLRPGDHVVDLGSASGAVGLIAAQTAPDLSLTFVDREPEQIALCRRNIAANGLDGRAAAIACDLFSSRAERERTGLPTGGVDVVLTNPPFFSGRKRRSPDPGRTAAHDMVGGDLPEWLHVAADLLKPRGRLWMIHRAESLDTCLTSLGRAFGSITVVPVHPRADAAASRVLIGAVKGGRAPLRIEPALVLHCPDGSWTDAARALHGPK